MIDILNADDPNLVGLFDPDATDTTLPGDPGLGRGLRWFPLGTVQLDAPDALVVQEPTGPNDMWHPTRERFALRVAGCAPGTWNAHVARLWGDRWARTLTYELRFALAEHGDPDGVWDWDAEADNEPGVTGDFCEDGGVLVAAFEGAAVAAGVNPSWSDLTSFLHAPGEMDFTPRLLDPPVGVFSHVNGHGADAKARRGPDGLATEVRLGLATADDLPALLADQVRERAVLDARLTELNGPDGYPMRTDRCLLCGEHGVVRVPVHRLLEALRPGHRPITEVFVDVPEPFFDQIVTGVHPACQVVLRRRFTWKDAEVAAGRLQADEYPWQNPPLGSSRPWDQAPSQEAGTP